MKIRELNGYRVIFKPEHPSAWKSKNWAGYLYEHVFIIEKDLDRILENDEHVHHLDGNKQHNSLSNLIIISNKDHGKIHKWIDDGCEYKKEYDEKYCKTCGIFLYTLDSTIYCSNECRAIDNRKATRPSCEDLIYLLKSDGLSYKAVGRMYNVSDNAIRKWVKKFGYDPKTLKPLTS